MPKQSTIRYHGMFSAPEDEELAKMRARKRRYNQRLTFDCFKAQVLDGKVSCKLGYEFKIGIRTDGCMTLETCLKGSKLPHACFDCAEYDDKEEYPPEWVYDLPIDYAKNVLTEWLREVRKE